MLVRIVEDSAEKASCVSGSHLVTTYIIDSYIIDSYVIDYCVHNWGGFLYTTDKIFTFLPLKSFVNCMVQGEPR